jgi:hypothetical protein
LLDEDYEEKLLEDVTFVCLYEWVIWFVVAGGTYLLDYDEFDEKVNHFSFSLRFFSTNNYFSSLAWITNF